LEKGKILAVLPISQISIPEVRASARLTEEQYAYLKATAEKYGIIQPIIVREKREGGFELIAGKTRLDEQIRQGREDVEALVVDADKKDALLMHIAENLARGTSDPISIAKVLQELVSEGATHEEISRVTSHTVEWVKFYLGLLKLPEVYQDALKEERLSVSAIQQALRLDEPEEIDYCLTQTLRLGWSASMVKHYVDRRLEELKMAKAREKVLGEPVHPPAPDAERLIKYERCMLCDRTVIRDEVYMNLICSDCRALTRYILEHVGPPKEALDSVYQALDRHFRYEQYQKLKEEFEGQAPS